MRFLSFSYGVALLIVLAVGSVYLVMAPMTWQIRDSLLDQFPVVESQASFGEDIRTQPRPMQNRAPRSILVFGFIFASYVGILASVALRFRWHRRLLPPMSSGPMKWLLFGGVGIATLAHLFLLTGGVLIILFVERAQTEGDPDVLAIPMFFAFSLYVLAVFWVEVVFLFEQLRKWTFS